MSGDRPSWTYPKGRDIGLRSIGGGPPSARGSGAPPPWARPPSRDREAPFRSLSEQRRPKESAASRLFGEDKPLKLRKTEGVEAVAAWAARREILGLLESGADPESLITLLREGKEEGPMLLDSQGSPRSQSPRSKSPLSDQPSEVDSRKWFSNSTTPASSGRSSDARGAVGFGGLDFGRKAMPPPEIPTERGRRRSTTSRRKPLEEEIDPPKETSKGGDKTEVLDDEDFKKRATPPPPPSIPLDPVQSDGYVQAKIPTRANATEQDILEKFQSITLTNYESLVLLSVKMELTDLVYDDKPDGVDEEKFHWYTEPRNAGTGYRYACLLKKLIEFHTKAYGECTLDPPILGRDSILKFIESLIRDDAGFRTPQGVLYALEWFGVAFGYQTSGIRWPRCKRMADDYAKRAPSSNPAPYMEVAVLGFLEKVLLDTTKALYVRITAGKLRLCAQAAIRHSDLTRTSFDRLEWCRLKGTTGVLGLRAKVERTKTGPRPWVASHLGVVPRHDNWLPTLIDLLAQAHGEGWHTQKFIGCEVNSEGGFNLKPATIEADAIIIRQLMVSERNRGVNIPLPLEVAKRLRWHGAKATMPTFMTHFGVKSKTVRHTGAWAKAADTMPDVYLRESQLLVLKAQIEVLTRLRRGETIGALEGLRIADFPKDFAPPPEEPTSGRRGNESAPAMDKRVFAMEPSSSFGPFLPDARELCEELIDEIGQGTNDELKVTREKEVKEVEEPEVVEGKNPYLGATSDSASDSDVDDPDEELETYFSSFLVGDRKSSRVHKPLKTEGQTMPMCRVRGGNFQKLRVTEAWSGNTMLCIRCFGKFEGCSTLCSFRKKVDGRELRCGRRCTLGCGRVGDDADDRVHSCALHMSENMDRDI